MEIVYIQTTIVSYLVARPPAGRLAHQWQGWTEDWWRLRRPVLSVRFLPTCCARRRRATRRRARQFIMACRRLPGEDTRAQPGRAKENSPPIYRWATRTR